MTSLRDLGCDVAQGYVIHRPVPAIELGTWMSSRLGAEATALSPTA